MGVPQGWELVLIVIVIMVLFGAKRLPDASRSLGRSLRIFKAETKGLRNDDDTTVTTQDAAVQGPAQPYVQTPVAPPAPITPPAPVAPPATGQQPHTTP